MSAILALGEIRIIPVEDSKDRIEIGLFYLQKSSEPSTAFTRVYTK